MRYIVKLIDGRVVGQSATFTGACAIVAQYPQSSGEIVDTQPQLAPVYW